MVWFEDDTSFLGSVSFQVLLLMEEILHQLVGSLPHFFQAFLASEVVSRISAINTKTAISSYNDSCKADFPRLMALSLRKFPQEVALMQPVPMDTTLIGACNFGSLLKVIKNLAAHRQGYRVASCQSYGKWFGIPKILSVCS